MSIKKYTFLEYLGNGNFGYVYRVKDNFLNAEKAIKVIMCSKPDEVLNNIEEAQLLHKCKHKNIVTINDALIDSYQDAPCIIIDMELANNRSLQSAIKSKQLSIYEMVKVHIDCLFGLSHAHQQGVIHRDIKPANILLFNKMGKLSDFGLATLLNQHNLASPNGYIAHLAPEVLQGYPTTVQSDIYAMGVTLYRSVTYQQNWNGDFNHSFPNFVPKKLINIIKKACHNDKNKRYLSATEFMKALSALRTNIDWKMIDSNLFVGKHNQDDYLISISGSYTCEVKRNNRKVTNDCRNFTSYDDALNYMYQYIANTQFF